MKILNEGSRCRESELIFCRYVDEFEHEHQYEYKSMVMMQTRKKQKRTICALNLNMILLFLFLVFGLDSSLSSVYSSGSLTQCVSFLKYIFVGKM